MVELTHASFFSGVGGTDLGLERAGWRTVSFSEIDPYACAVLAERWPDVANLGSIVDLVQQEPTGGLSRAFGAVLWSGGFPCQDLSVAGKRRGMVDGTRSNLAYAFLALVERHRPPAILLENVPGLLSSHGGRDMAALCGRMVELGYGVAYRVLDAQHFGVPQRRRRVFIVGLRSGPDDADGRLAAERAAAVLSVGARCGRHPATGHEAGPGTAERPRVGTDLVGALDGTFGHHGVAHSAQSAAVGHYVANGLRASDGHHGYSSPRGDGADNLVSTPPDADRVRAADGLAGRLDDSRVAATLNSGVEQVIELIATELDPLLPLGLDSHRYRCCGNGVVAPVAEWIGRQLAEALA